jgi:transcriptional regulator with XRE-family HTH domain
MSEKCELIDRLSNSKRTREAYIRSKVSTNVASQIRALRRREGLTQEGLAELSEMKQSRISAVERPGTRLTVETLVRLASALKIGLTVRFGSFSEMLDWENGFSQDEFDVLNIDEDIDFHREERPAARAVSQLVSIGGGSASAVNPVEHTEQEERYGFLLAQINAPNKPLASAAGYGARA